MINGMESEWWQQEQNIVAVRDYAIQNGLLLRATKDPKDDRCVHVALTLVPSRFPEELFHLAHEIQEDINTVIDAVSRDHEFLTSVLGR